MNAFNYNDLSYAIIGTAMEVHNNLGPGLLEKVYRHALAYELRAKGYNVDVEVPIALNYKGLHINEACRADIIVNNQIIIELKATETNNGIYAKQLFTYLKLTGLRLGLVINFNQIKLSDGITRVINNDGKEL